MSVILGIETSCDETGVAAVRDGREILANEIASQVADHAPFGGVVPEIASRQHTQCISQLAERVLDAVGERIDAVAATQGPGLMGSLMVGLSFAKAVAYAWGIPIIPVHHIEGHLFSTFLGENPPEFPFLALVVSGGHTCLIQCREPHHYQVLGSTRDDAVGECFDKAARLLGLPYPGGPSIQHAAEGGDPHAFDFPRGMLKEESLEFSYSGLKTAVLYKLREVRDPDSGEPAPGIEPPLLADMAASFQWAAVDVLVVKTKLALRQTGAKRLVLAGGVAANRLLRERLYRELGVPVHMPPIRLCVDNGAMIAAAAHSRFERGFLGTMRATPDPNLPLQ